MTAYKELGWIFAGLIIWYAVRMVSPRAAGYMLAAIVIGVIVLIGPKVAKL